MGCNQSKEEKGTEVVNSEAAPKATADKKKEQKGKSSVEFSNQIEPVTVFELTINIIRADGVAKKDLFGKSDPYVVVRCIGDGEMISSRTRVIENDLSPVWNEEFVMETHEKRIFLTMWDSDPGTVLDDFLGYVELPVPDVTEEPKEYTLELGHKANYEKEEVKGTITFSVALTATREVIGWDTTPDKEEHDLADLVNDLFTTDTNSAGGLRDVLREVARLFVLVHHDVPLKYHQMMNGLVKCAADAIGDYPKIPWTKKSKVPVAIDDFDFCARASHYMRFATAVYGAKVVFKEAAASHLTRDVNIKERMKKLAASNIASTISPKKFVELQIEAVSLHCAMDPADYVCGNWTYAQFKPSYIVVKVPCFKSVLICIRGTISIQDALTDLLATSAKLLHGVGHKGMVAAAKYVYDDCIEEVRKVMQECPDYSLHVTGHSLGAGTASVLTFLLLEEYEHRGLHCWAFACPATASPDLCEYAREKDIIRLSYLTVRRLYAQMRDRSKDIVGKGIVRNLLTSKRQKLREQEISAEQHLSENPFADLFPPGRVYMIGKMPKNHPLRKTVKSNLKRRKKYIKGLENGYIQRPGGGGNLKQKVAKKMGNIKITSIIGKGPFCIWEVENVPAVLGRIVLNVNLIEEHMMMPYEFALRNVEKWTDSYQYDKIDDVDSDPSDDEDIDENEDKLADELCEEIDFEDIDE